MVALLLEFGANVDASSESGLTPLGYAAAAGFLSIVVLLCKKRAQVLATWLCCSSFLPAAVFLLSCHLVGLGRAYQTLLGSRSKGGLLHTSCSLHRKTCENTLSAATNSPDLTTKKSSPERRVRKGKWRSREAAVGSLNWWCLQTLSLSCGRKTSQPWR